MESMSLLSAALLLLLIIDPFGNLVTINALLAEMPKGRRQVFILRECLLAFAVLALFLFAGNALLGFLGIRAPTLSVSGGIVLFLIAIRMVFPSRSHPIATVDGEPVLVPIAVPLIAGPSTLAILMLMANRDPSRLALWFGALALAMTASTLVLWLSPLFYERLGRPFTNAIERLVGMILIMLSVQMLLDGIGQYFAAAP